MTINNNAQGNLRITSIFNPDGTGGTNGMAHSQNPAHDKEIFYNHFPHRTNQELFFHQALRARQAKLDKNEGGSFIFSPLPTFVYCGKRIETDFIILKDGITYIIEIDGDSHIGKLALDEKERTQPFEANGIWVYRIRCDQNSDIEWAHTAVDEALINLERIIKRR